jgi:hypothetical protein
MIREPITNLPVQKIPRRYVTGIRLSKLHGDHKGRMSQIDMTMMRRETREGESEQT